MRHWYYNVLVDYPKSIVASILILCICCIFTSIYFEELPDFSDPSLGFEARGTDIANKLSAWQNLLEETRPSGRLTANPYEYSSRRENSFKRVNSKAANKKGDRQKALLSKDKNSANNAQNKLDHETSDGIVAKHNINKRKSKKAERKDDYFCDAPSREYAHFVIERVDRNVSNTSMLDHDAISAMCDLESKLTTVNKYRSVCQNKLVSKQPCRPWSVPNYFAVLSNKTDCADLEAADITRVKELLGRCFEFYNNESLKSDCEYWKCNTPAECMQFNAVYNIFHFLLDSKVNGTYLNAVNAMIFLPIARSPMSLPFYYNINSSSTSNGIVAVVAMDMGAKNALFDDLLYADSWLIGLGAVFVLLLILIYTKSFIVTMTAVLANVLVIGVAYFIYRCVFRLEYFPFMNFLAIVVIIGIGADDCFVYIKEWKLALREWNKSADRSATETSTKILFLVTNTLDHTAKSIFVTSLTTAFAFFASYFSAVTAIKCFGIFAGTAVLVNYCFMMTWLPAIFVIVERCEFYRSCSRWRTRINFPNINAQFSEFIQKSIIASVVKLKYAFIVFFVFIGISSGIIVLYYPKFGLPDSQTLQLFKNDHPFELYDNKYRNLFWFEKSFIELETFKMPIRFVWGVKPVDDGNYLMPKSRGPLYLEENFTISSAEAQLWTLKFCKNLKQQPFYQSNSIGALYSSCFIENFIQNMNIRCFDDMIQKNRSCCEHHKFPYQPNVFDSCLPEVISSLYRSPRYIFIPGAAGPKFERRPHSTIQSNETINTLPRIRALIIEYESTQPFTTSYKEIANFTASVENWFDRIRQNAPNDMKRGWFTSELNFYDLQETLSTGTITAASIAMISSLIVLLLFTMNLPVSIYAALTVTFAIFTSIAILVLLGWRLNILESIAASTAVGLGIDFTLHYSINYRLSAMNDRKSATEYALSRMIGPTAMAALTTGFAGSFMIFSDLIAYVKIGIFLIIVMTVSWVYATFFFTSLLHSIGPQNNFGQLLCAKRAADNDDDNKIRHAQTVTDRFIRGNNHEMQELAATNKNTESNALIASTDERD